MARSSARRYLCSQLITLRWHADTQVVNRVVNLEEISRTEAILEADAAVPAAAHVTLHLDKVRFHGTVTQTSEHEFGWRIHVRLSPMTPWSPEVFQPEHMLDPSKLED